MKPLGLVFALSLFLFAATNASAESKSVTVNSFASIQEILELSVTGQGSSELRFGNVQASQTSSPSNMTVNVVSNSGSAYQLTHSLQGSLGNNTGDFIDAGNISFTSSANKGLGTPTNTPTPMITGPQTVYISDNQGTSDTITVSYVLSASSTQAPGDYTGAITYTASSI